MWNYMPIRWLINWSDSRKVIIKLFWVWHCEFGTEVERSWGKGRKVHSELMRRESTFFRNVCTCLSNYMVSYPRRALPCGRKISVGKIISSFKISLEVNLPPLRYKVCMYLRSKVNATHLLVLAYKYFKTKPFLTYGP